jgi:hypothetical protein
MVKVERSKMEELVWNLIIKEKLANDFPLLDDESSGIEHGHQRG